MTAVDPISKLFLIPTPISKRIDAVCSHISGRWLAGFPDMIRHVNAAKPILASSEPPRPDPPCPTADDLPDSNAGMPDRLRTPILGMNGGWANPQHCALLHTLRLGSGDGRDR